MDFTLKDARYWDINTENHSETPSIPPEGGLAGRTSQAPTKMEHLTLLAKGQNARRDKPAEGVIILEIYAIPAKGFRIL